jgi:LemA protein
MGWIVVLVAAAVLVVWGVGVYNGLVRLRNGSESAWSDIDVQLKRRWELIPNLVETVKGYASHERQTLEEVVAARGQAMAASGTEAKADAEGGLTRSLRQLFALAERYPDLKANQNFLELQSQLSAIEDAIQNARRYFNAVVRDLNTRIESFPANLIAGATGFTRKTYFELGDETERSAPKVSFGS